MKRRLLSIAAVAAVLLSGCSSPKTNFEKLADYYSQTLTWRGCSNDLQCATLAVPLDYSNPAGERIELALARHPAGDGRNRLGSIVTNPGGPGGGGVDFLGGYQVTFGSKLIDKFDLVSWDPRGVAGSSPVDCVSDAKLDQLIASDATPDTSAEVAEFDRLSRQFNNGCLANTGKVLAHVSTMQTVRDLDILRAALGEKQLNFLGFSYGTLIGAVYAHTFPDRIGRLVLDGAVDPTADIVEGSLAQARGFDTALRRFAQFATGPKGNGELGRDPEALLARITDLLEDLDSTPLKTEDEKRPVTEALAWNAIVAPMYLADDGWTWLADVLVAAFKGNGTGLLEISDWFNNRDSDGKYLDNSTEAFYAITCDDYGSTSYNPADYIDQFVAAAPLTGRGMAWGLTMCNDWPVASEEVTTDVHVDSNRKILVIGTTYDPATPNADAISLARQLGDGGVYINFNGDGHTAYQTSAGEGSTALNNAVDKFFITGVAPADGTVYEPSVRLVP